MNNEPWDQGADAAERGEPLSNNPYEAETDSYQEWSDGWHYENDAMEECDEE